jgi:hypothetical protein
LISDLFSDPIPTFATPNIIHMPLSRKPSGTIPPRHINSAKLPYPTQGPFQNHLTNRDTFHKYRYLHHPRRRPRRILRRQSPRRPRPETTSPEISSAHSAATGSPTSRLIPGVVMTWDSACTI